MTRRALASAAACLVLGACAAEPVRTAEGLLVSEADRAETTDAIELFGQLRQQGPCLILARPGAGVFQPVFRKGATRAQLEKQVGTLDRPREVVVHGFDDRTPAQQGLGTATATRECPGRPFYFERMLPRDAAPRPPAPQR